MTDNFATHTSENISRRTLVRVKPDLHTEIPMSRFLLTTSSATELTPLTSH